MRIKKGAARAATHPTTSTRSGQAHGPVADELVDTSMLEAVRVLTRLAAEVEQLDSVISVQRHELLSEATKQAVPDEALLRRRSNWVSTAAKDMALRVRDALDELQRISHAPGLADPRDTDSRSERFATPT